MYRIMKSRESAGSSSRMLLVLGCSSCVPGWQRSSAPRLPVGCSDGGRQFVCTPLILLLGLLCPISSFVFQCVHQLIVLDNQVDSHRIAEAAPACRLGVPAAAAVAGAGAGGQMEGRRRQSALPLLSHGLPACGVPSCKVAAVKLLPEFASSQSNDVPATAYGPQVDALHHIVAPPLQTSRQECEEVWLLLPCLPAVPGRALSWARADACLPACLHAHRNAHTSLTCRRY